MVYNWETTDKQVLQVTYKFHHLDIETMYGMFFQVIFSMYELKTILFI